MAGHSHWSKIKRAKGATDAKRGKIWSKISRKIIIAAKNGGDPRDNLTLRYVIDEAKGVNMPKDTIEKAIKKGTGELGAENYEPVTYEAYAPGGVALIIDGLTNNRARTAGDRRRVSALPRTIRLNPVIAISQALPPSINWTHGWLTLRALPVRPMVRSRTL